jgi:hypothetical protein
MARRWRGQGVNQLSSQRGKRAMSESFGVIGRAEKPAGQRGHSVAEGDRLRMARRLLLRGKQRAGGRCPRPETVVVSVFGVGDKLVVRFLGQPREGRFLKNPGIDPATIRVPGIDEPAPIAFHGMPPCLIRFIIAWRASPEKTGVRGMRMRVRLFEGTASVHRSNLTRGFAVPYLLV